MSGLVALLAVVTAVVVFGGACYWLAPSRRSQDTVVRFVIFTAVVPLVVLLAYAGGDPEVTILVVINYAIALVPIGVGFVLWRSRQER